MKAISLYFPQGQDALTAQVTSIIKNLMKRYFCGLVTIFLTLCLVTMCLGEDHLGEKAEPGTQEKLNLNTATVEELSSLPKISVRNAKSIVIYREKYGPFKRIEDINKVPGIDRREYRAIKDMVTVEQQEPADNRIF